MVELPGYYLIMIQSPYSSIGVYWKVGADALLPDDMAHNLLIPISMLVEWDAKKGHLFHPLILMMEGP